MGAERMSGSSGTLSKFIDQPGKRGRNFNLAKTAHGKRLEVDFSERLVLLNF